MQVTNRSVLKYTLLLSSQFVEWLAINPVNDVKADTSATENSLSCDSLIWTSACFVSSRKVIVR